MGSQMLVDFSSKSNSLHHATIVRQKQEVTQEPMCKFYRMQNAEITTLIGLKKSSDLDHPISVVYFNIALQCCAIIWCWYWFHTKRCGFNLARELKKLSNVPWGAAIAPWIRLRLPSCCPGFESQAHHLCFHQFIKLCNVEKTKINKNRPGLAHFFKNFLMYLE